MNKNHTPKSTSFRDRVKHYLENIVYGANDGIITTFVVVSGAKGADLSPSIIIILGLINLLADGFSMGASCFLSIRSSEQTNKKDRGYIEPAYHGIMTFFSFVFFGFVPLISYFVPSFYSHKFLISTCLTGSILFIVGSLRAFIDPKKWFISGIEMLIVGGTAATIAYYAGVLLAHIK